MSLICISLVEKTVPEIMEYSNKCKVLGTDIVEVRLDFLKKSVSSTMLDELLEFKRKTGLPVILTLRPDWEGGNFKGKEDQRIVILKEIIERRFDYLDLEYKMDKTKRNELILMARKNNVKTIVSHHDFRQTPTWEEILNQIQKCVKTKGDIAKVVYYNNSLDDCLNILKAGFAAKKLNLEFTVLGMGPYGHVTRILAPAVGCQIIYAALEKGKEAIFGQTDVATLREIWKILGLS